MVIYGVMSELRQALVNDQNSFDAMTESAQSNGNKEQVLLLSAKRFADQVHIKIKTVVRGCRPASSLIASARFSTKGESGTGLGLSMVQKTSNLMEDR